MSGFEFYVACGHCGLSSPTCRWRYDHTVEPEHLVLPATNRSRQTFEQVSIPIEHELDAAQMAELAAAQSTGDVTVYVPHFGEEPGVVLKPAPVCPRCGSGSVAATLGHNSEPPRTVATVDEAIGASRSLADGALLEVHLTEPPAVFRCQRDCESGRVVFAWHVHRIGTANVAPIAEGLIAKLTALGSTCDEPTRLRAFTRFREWTNR